ncbi:MAG: lipocalin family protein [Bdellovibrionota bacterium]|nr:lipocalin family protein [Bdellovibrionota bacterium]
MSLKSLFFLVILNFISPILKAEALKSVESLELKSYLGLWHEYLRLPNQFEDKEGKFCFDVTAEYYLMSDESLSVKNTCHFLEGKNLTKEDVAIGRAVIADTSSNARLKVEFIPIPILRDIVRWVSEPNYIVIGLGEKNSNGQYSWSVVGSPDRKYAWVLSRKPVLAKEDIELTRQILEKQGFDYEKMIRPIQPKPTYK